MCYIVEKNVSVVELSYTKSMYIRAALAVVIIAGIVLGVFFFWPSNKNSNEDIIVDDSLPVVDEERYEVEHDFDDGIHTISGTVTLPTPCHELNENIRIAESFPEQVFVDLTTVNTGGICIQVIDERAFSIDVEVSEEATFALTFDGVDISVPKLVVQ